MKYIILVFDSSDKLERQVNRRLEEGWKLHGNLQVITQMLCPSFIQAMVKTEEQFEYVEC